VLEDIYVRFWFARSAMAKAGMLFTSPAAQNTTPWRLYRNTRPQGETKEVFVNNCLYFAADDTDEKHAIENVRVWVRHVNTEAMPGAQYAFRRSDAWIFGFKSEDASRLFLAGDHTRLEVLGGTNYNWSVMKGPAIVSRDSRSSVLFGFRSQLGVGEIVITAPPAPLTETILREEADGNVRTLLATQVKRNGSKERGRNGAVIAICPHVDIK
jgi:hypothetical protein